MGTAKENGGKLSMELSVTAAKHARVVLTAEQEFENVNEMIIIGNCRKSSQLNTNYK